MTRKRLAPFLTAVLTLALYAAGWGSSTAVAGGPCSAYAATFGNDSDAALGYLQWHGRGAPGGLYNPYRSPQKLISSLWAGQTGCLLGGTYNIGSQLTFEHGGYSGLPITLRSYPNQTATLVGGTVYVRSGSNYVNIQNLHIDSAASSQPGIEIMAAATQLVANDITNESTGNSCVMLGDNKGDGPAIAPVLFGNTIHQCGLVADGNQDHGVYFDNAIAATVTHNLIWGVSGYAIHLYESAQYNRITQNVIADNGYGVIFAGDDTYQSNNNYVGQNIIAGTTTGPGLSSYYSSTQGQGNAAWDNCVSGHWPSIVDGLGYNETYNTVADPMFTYEPWHIYTLQSGSPCLDVSGGDVAARVYAGL